jgi:hypothetical protein
MTYQLLREFVSSLLFEGRLEDIQKRYPGKEEDVQRLASSDPSGNMKYLEWMAKQVLKLDEPAEEVVELVGIFHKVVNKLKIKDLNGYKTLGDLRSAVEELGGDLRSGTAKRREAKANAETIYDDDNFFVVLPHDKEASQHYGAGSKWCIAATQSQNYYQSYSSRSIGFFFIIDKHGKPSDPMHKVALAFYLQDHALKPNIWDRLEIYNAKDVRIKLPVVAKNCGSAWSAISAAIDARLKTYKETAAEAKLKAMTMPQRLEYSIVEKTADPDMYPYVRKTDDPEIWPILLKHPDNYYTSSAMSNPNVPPEFRRAVAKTDSYEGKAAKVHNQILDDPRSVLEILRSIYPTPDAYPSQGTYDALDQRISALTDPDELDAIIKFSHDKTGGTHAILAAFKNQHADVEKWENVALKVPPTIQINLIKRNPKKMGPILLGHSENFNVTRAALCACYYNGNEKQADAFALTNANNTEMLQVIVSATQNEEVLAKLLRKDKGDMLAAMASSGQRGIPDYSNDYTNQTHHPRRQLPWEKLVALIKEFLKTRPKLNPRHLATASQYSSLPADLFEPYLMSTPGDKAKTLYLYMARRIDVSPEALMKIAVDGPENSKMALAKNPTTPIEVLNTIANDTSEKVRKAAGTGIRRKAKNK